MQSTPLPAGAIPYGNNPRAGQYIKAGDARMYVEVYGKGKPLVVLPGGGVGSTYETARLIDSSAKTCQIIAISTRGHGKSEIGHSPLTYAQKVNNVYAVIQASTKDSVTVLGFRDGAYTGYKLVSLYPARVKKLIAIGAGEQVPGLRKVIRNVKEMGKRNNLYINQQLALIPEPERLQGYRTTLANFHITMTASKGMFASIRCAVLLLSGERDQNAPLAAIIAAYQIIPHSQFSIIPDAPHPYCWLTFRLSGPA